MKKEFTTNWSVEEVKANLGRMPIPRARFFNDREQQPSEIIVPDDITYDNLCFFVGRKTKVTIETVD